MEANQAAAQLLARRGLQLDEGASPPLRGLSSSQSSSRPANMPTLDQEQLQQAYFLANGKQDTALRLQAAKWMRR
ncbi:hypothetical protein ACVW0Q_001995 [Thermostichus sp. MS-CIW-21]|jgi:hypothetical protein